MKLKVKRTKKPDLATQAKAGDLGLGVDKPGEKSVEIETNPQRLASAPKIDMPKAEGSHFEPSFDPFFDGDQGSIDSAVKYLMAKALSSSAQQAASVEAVETKTASKEELREQPPVEPVARTVGAVEESKEANDVDLLRVRLWRARASHSRQAGLALVILSAAFFAGAFFTSALILEIGSVSSFMSGVALLAYEAEPRVKLFPSISSLIGPLKIVENELEQRGVSKAEAVFEGAPSDGDAKEQMTFVGDSGAEDAPRYSIPPLGEGLVHAYELELGDLTKLKIAGAKVWLPRVMVDGLGLAERVDMKSSGNEVTTVIEKPFVRALCVQDFMTDGPCRFLGCPLAASVGQALARATGTPVTHHGCMYDPVTQKATLKDTLGQ